MPSLTYFLAFSLVPAVMWPCIAYVVPERRLGFAYGLMDAVQQAGLVCANLLVGWSNDHFHASPANPGGYAGGMWMFSAVGVVALFFAIWLRKVENGPHGHGLETIK